MWSACNLIDFLLSVKKLLVGFIRKNVISVEVRNKFGTIRAPHLYKTLGDTNVSRMTYNFLLFQCCQRTVDFRMSAGFKERHVLIHNRNIHLVAKSFMNPV